MKRIVPPIAQVVTLEEMKEHLRLSPGDDHEDLLIQSLIDAAVSWLDGWDGVLGRCIMPQTWQIEAADLVAGFRLPDVTEAVENEDGSLTVTCAMPAEKLPSVQAAAKLIVGQWFANREAALEKSLEAQPMAVRALLEPLRNA